MDLFQHWLDFHNVRRALIVKPYAQDDGYCLVASKALTPGETTIEIPELLLMSSISAKNSPSFAKVYRVLCPKSDPDLEANTTSIIDLDGLYDSISQEVLILSLFLLHERSKLESSLWHPYIALLPRTFTTPLFFTPQELTLLEPTPLHSLALTMLETLQVLHTRIVLPLLQTFPTLLNPSSATPAALLWAYTAIESRAFKLNLIGADPLVLNTTLVPLADLANHVPSARDATLRIERFDPHTRMLRIVCAETAPAAGRELHLCYNDLANWQLLLYYGFTILQNPFDRVNLSFGPPDDDDGEVKKLMLLALGEELGFGLEHSVQASWVEGADQVVGAGLVGSLRLLLMDEEDLSRYSVENLETLLRESASERNEQAVLETLRGLFEGMREQYPTTLGEDQERVEAVVGEGLSRGEYYTLLYLVGQKEIIDNALEWVEAREECQVSGNTLDGGSQSPSVPR